VCQQNNPPEGYSLAFWSMEAGNDGTMVIEKRRLSNKMRQGSKA
jgi:hypothetical protein